MKSDPIRGKTVRWTFNDGLMAGKTFEHVFGVDGKVTWREVGGEAKAHAEPAKSHPGKTESVKTAQADADSAKASQGKTAPAKAHQATKFEVAPVNEDVCAISYLSESGYTLTAVLDFKKETVVGIVSNEKQLLVQHGTFEIASQARELK